MIIENVLMTVLGGIVTIVFGGLIYVIKTLTSAQEKIAVSLERLANNVAYCPLNKSNKDKIKETDV